MYIDKFTELGYSSISNFKEASVSSMKKASEFLENTCGCGGMADAPALGAGG